MVKIPWESFKQGLAPGKIYYFSTKDIPTPHFHICVGRTKTDMLFFVCATSQFKTVSRFVESRGLPTETLVYINPTNFHDSPFDRETFVNCNTVSSLPLEQIRLLYEEEGFKFRGELSENYADQVLIGLHKSPLIDAEIKEAIPLPPSMY